MRTKYFAAVLVGTVMAVSLTGPAIANVAATDVTDVVTADGGPVAKGDQILVAPPAPPGAALAARMGIAAVAPETSPGVTSHPIPPGGTYTCSAGYFCPIVWNPVDGKWKIFFMYYCRIQSLYNWEGLGYWYNNQIPPVNPVGIFDQNWGWVSAPVVENPRRQRQMDSWSPAWYIDVC